VLRSDRRQPGERRGRVLAREQTAFDTPRQPAQRALGHARRGLPRGNERDGTLAERRLQDGFRQRSINEKRAVGRGYRGASDDVQVLSK
jgi:hypothetical protein